MSAIKNEVLSAYRKRRVGLISEFARERLMPCKGERVRAGVVLENYNAWAQERHHPRMSARELGGGLRGCVGVSTRRGGYMWYEGYRLAE